MRTVVALGGNALAPGGEAAIAAQRERIEATAGELRALYEAGHELVVTHGNGPQVGALLRQQEAADAPERPLDVLVAETQAQLGYRLQQALDERIHASVVSVVTQVEVDPGDAAFDEPSKPVGPYLSAEQAGERDFETADVTTPEGETAHRRVVPSPKPRRILEGKRVESLVADGEPVVCGGGGGVPVTVGDNGIEGVEAVVDKDYTTRLVAERVGADVLVMATDVPCVYAAFGTPEQSRIADATAAEMRERLAAGEFGEGSMEPKIRACLEFLDAGGERAVVAGTEDVAAAADGDAGTQIHSD